MNEPLQPALCAYLDILGFTEAIERAYSERKEAKLLAEIYKALDAAAERINSAGERLPMVSVKFFTDNVVVGYSYWTEGAKAELARDVVEVRPRAPHVGVLADRHQPSAALDESADGGDLRGLVTLGRDRLEKTK